MTPNSVALRAATLADAERLAQLWALTFADKFGPILGKKTERVLYDWFRLSQRHLQTTILAHLEETVVGFIVLETPNAPPPDDGRWLWHALQLHHGLFGALRALLLFLVIDNDHKPTDNEVYIEMLGVDPGWQGRGIAGHLLHHAEDVAQAEQAGQLTLNVVIENGPAIQLYQKRGFIIQAERRSRFLQWITGHVGYYEMRKSVDDKQLS